MNRNAVLAAAGVVLAIALAILVTSVDATGPAPESPEPSASTAPPSAPPAGAPSPRAVPSPAPSRSSAETPASDAPHPSALEDADPLWADAGADDDAEKAPAHEVSVWPLNKEGIQGAVGEALPGMKACYDEALARDPALAGRMTLGFTVVDADGIGKVTVVELDNGEVADDGMIDCVLDTFEGLQFDPPQGGGELAVSYPVTFRTEDD